jgi:hypothetical protein
MNAKFIAYFPLYNLYLLRLQSFSFTHCYEKIIYLYLSGDIPFGEWRCVEGGLTRGAAEVSFGLLTCVFSTLFSGHPYICYLEAKWIAQAPCDWKRV